MRDNVLRACVCVCVFVCVFVCGCVCACVCARVHRHSCPAREPEGNNARDTPLEGLRV